MKPICLVSFLLLFFSQTLFVYTQADMTIIETETYTFNAQVMGNPEHDAVFLLHGFPESSAMWKRLQAELVEYGFYCIAPDQRGYSPDARPKGCKHYTIELLAKDIIEMADALAIDSFHLIAHDWGSAIAWYLAAVYPDRIKTLTAMSVPHVKAFSYAIKHDKKQYKASGYMRFFNWPLIPELALKANEYERLISIWEKSSEDEIEDYLTLYKQPGTLTAALNWYRANYKRLKTGDLPDTPVEVPTLFIWGKNDPAILKSGVDKNRDYIATKDYRELFLDSGHWLIQESYPEVSKAIISMLRTYNK